MGTSVKCFATFALDLKSYVPHQTMSFTFFSLESLDAKEVVIEADTCQFCLAVLPAVQVMQVRRTPAVLPALLVDHLVFFVSVLLRCICGFALTQTIKSAPCDQTSGSPLHWIFGFLLAQPGLLHC